MNGVTMADLDSIQDDGWVHNTSGTLFPSHEVRYSVSNPPQFPSSGTKKKTNGKGKRGQKLPNKINQLPPMDSLSRDLAEKKIEELQRVASTSRTILDSVQGPMSLRSSASMPLAYPANSVVSSTISGSEADFLARQIQSTSDLSQLTVLNNPEEFQSIAKGMGMSSQDHSGQYNPSGSQISSGNMNTMAQNNHQIVVDALREKIISLEKQAHQSNTMIQKKEQELEKKDLRLRSMITEIEQLKREHVNDLKRVQNEVTN